VLRQRRNQQFCFKRLSGLLFSLDRSAMNSRWLKITGRFAGAILLVFAVGRLFADIFSSFQLKSHSNPGGGGTIDNVFAVDSLTIIMGSVGLLLLAFSLLTPRNRA
jgi:hypothetical protein